MIVFIKTIKHGENHSFLWKSFPYGIMNGFQEKALKGMAFTKGNDIHPKELFQELLLLKRRAFKGVVLL